MEQTCSKTPAAEAIDLLGGDTAVMKLAGLKTSWAISKWRTKLPAERTLWLAEQTNFTFTPHQLNPEMYPNPTDGLPADRSNVETTAAL